MNFNIKAERRKPDTRVYTLTFQKKKNMCEQISNQYLKQDGGGGVIAYKEAEENSLRQRKHIQGYICLPKLTELYSKNNALHCVQSLAQQIKFLKQGGEKRLYPSVINGTF